MKIETMSYIMEVMNCGPILYAAPIFYVIISGPLPLWLAQLAYIWVHCCFLLILALGSAVSCFQLCYVIKFDLVFAIDPQAV